MCRETFNNVETFGKPCQFDLDYRRSPTTDIKAYDLSKRAWKWRNDSVKLDLVPSRGAHTRTSMLAS